ncbi:MAG TPA: dihydrofolate reductase [Solirubrobacteraceae bacterium]|nr:dihydrofolate reductase [Solirubrobacteraceae bacterium]
MRCIVVAYGANRGIGYRGQLPWRLPSDMRHFRELTIGSTVLMGRKTFQSLPDAYRPLPGRRNLVVSANPHFDPSPVEAGERAEPGGGEEPSASGGGATSVEVHASIEAALAACGEGCFVIGGGSIYEQTLGLVERVYATVVHDTPLSDTYFLELAPEQWRCSERTQDICENGTHFHFATYDRIR